MKRDFYPWQTALVLLLVTVILRLLGAHFVGTLPNVSPLMALAFVGAMYFPRKWGWLVGLAALVITDLAFGKLDLKAIGQIPMLWVVMGIALPAVLYVAASGFGIWIAQRKSLAKILAGSVVCSLVFYVAMNTFAWVLDSVILGQTNSYAATFAGWLQSNTTGLPGYEPSWLFLRNAAAGDLFFALVLLLVLDRALLFGHSGEKATPRMA